MSTKLGAVKLNEAQKQAIAEMVETDGFKIWKKKLMPARALQIAGFTYNMEPTSTNMAKLQGQAFENSMQISKIEDIAKAYHAGKSEDD